MGLFIEREKAPFDYKVKGYDENDIAISKNISLYANKDDHFFVDYDLRTFDSSLYNMSAGQMKKVADTILEFLRVYGENGEKKVGGNGTDVLPQEQADIAFGIKEDERLPLARTAPWINKRINKEGNEEAELAYFIDVNEIHSPELSFHEFVTIYHKLGDFLEASRKA